MAFSLVQQANNFPADFPSTIPVITTGSAVTKGNLLLAFCANATGQNLISDSHNFWIPIAVNKSGGYGVVSAWYAIAKKTEILTVKFFSGQATGGSTQNPLSTVACQLLEFSGNAGVPFDASSFTTGSSTAPASSVTSVGTNELFWGCGIGAVSATLFPGAGWTSSVPSTDYASIFATEAAAGAASPTFVQNPTGSWCVIAACFKPSSISSYTISGALGSAGAGATVLFTSATTTVVYSATADSNGNYTSPALYPDTYIVQAQLVGQTFSPASSNVAISNANVTGENFTASSIRTDIILNPSVVDTLNYANVNPINATNWPQDGSPIPPWDPTFQVLNGECTFSDLTIYSNLSGPWSAGAMTTNRKIVYPSNQFASFEIDSLNATAGSWATFQLQIRASSDCTIGQFMGVFNNGDGTCQIICGNRTDSATLPAGTGNCVPPNPSPAGIKSYQPSFLNLLSVPWALGDKFSFACVGNAYYVLHNGVVIGNYLDSTTLAAAPAPGMIAYGLAHTDVQVSNFNAGMAVLSQESSFINYSFPGNNNGSGTTLTFGPWFLTAGDTVAIAIRNGQAMTVSSVVDTAGNTYHHKTKYTNGSVEVQFWYCYNAIGNAANTITVTFSGTVQTPNGYLWDIFGTVSGDPTDVDAGGTNAGSSPITSSSFSTAQAKELLLAFATTNATGNTNAFVQQSGWVLDNGSIMAGGGVNCGASHLLTSTSQSSITADQTIANNGTGWTFSGIAALSIKIASSSKWYPLDCRHYGSFPLTPVIVQGSGIYALDPNSDNSKLPPTDSRKTKPIDCRVVEIIPENSRVNPNPNA